jgi:DNA-binding CsgD family transcriptional regulator
MGHRLLYANPAMRSITRKSVEVGCVDFLLDVAPGAGRAVRRGFLEVQKGARSSYSRIVPLVVRDRSIPVRLSMTLFGNASDEPVVLGSVTRMFSVRADQSVDEEALESAERAIERIMVEVAAVLPDAAPAATTLQFDDLSVRQNEILGLILAGHDIESISHRLHLSQHTVRNHTQAILRCLGVHSKADLIAYCRSVKPTPVDALFSPPR